MRTRCKGLVPAVFILFALILASGCKKFVREGELQGGVALTFDDHYIDDWFRYLPMLDSFGAKATFYISSYTSLSKEQRQKLKILQQHGNEIAFHTTHHPDLVKQLKTRSLADVMKREVFDGVDSMAKDGFHPVSFAYPFGKHNDILDAAFIKVFRSIRVLNGTKDYTQSVCKTQGKTYFRGLGIDEGSTTNDVLGTMLENAKSHHNCIVLVGHHIGSRFKPNVPVGKLAFILQKAQDLRLRFYTIQELSR